MDSVTSVNTNVLFTQSLKNYATDRDIKSLNNVILNREVSNVWIYLKTLQA
ncbi:MAG: hypothetical protein ABI686_12810 [Acidobacteriota bacterium]